MNENTISIRLNAEQLDKLSKESIRLNISRSELLRLLINTITL